MSDLVWWTLFAILSLFLIIFTVKLFYRVISDVWCGDDRDVNSDDAEEITRYRTDFRTIFKDVEVKDESDRIIMTKEFVRPEAKNGKTAFVTFKEAKPEEISMHAIEEEEDDNKNEEQKGREETKKLNENEEAKTDQDKTDGEKKPEEKKEEEDDFTEEERKILEDILSIQGETDIYAKQIPFCLGGKNHLTYYEINQKFLMSKIGLSAIDCNANEKLKRRKNVVSLYIQECQKELKKRADVSTL